MTVAHRLLNKIIFQNNISILYLYVFHNTGSSTSAFVIFLITSKNMIAPIMFHVSPITSNYLSSHIFSGDVETKVFTTRASIWIPTAYQVNWSWKSWPCHGKWVRGICIFGVGDLPWLHNRPELYANKLYADFQWLTYDCMEQFNIWKDVNQFSPKFSSGLLSKFGFCETFWTGD